MKKKSMKNQPPRPSVVEDKGLYFIPLGGSEEFGINLNVYLCDGHILLVDCGLGFADERFPGIDLLLPDPAFLEQHQDKIKALIITHAHEDHIGAVAYLWPRFKCPIYTGSFSAAVLEEKLNERHLFDVPVHIVDPLESLKIKPFEIQFIPVAHSIPDASALSIKTPYGTVLHSGDWNLDPEPVIGQITNPDHFRKAANDGVLAYIGDSTNAEVTGRAKSETSVEKGLAKEIKKCDGRVAVTIFSSNIGRIHSIVKAAQACGRDVAIVGRSLHRMIGAAIDCGYLSDIPDFIPEDDIGYLPDNKILMICTGSQGEYRSALAKMARNDHPTVSLKKGDTVIYSSRAIPGNERAINAVKNNLSAAGIHIITQRDTQNTIHASGHPCRDEIAEMYSWIKPELVIPVHGERTQLEAHARFALYCKIKRAIVPKNGTVIRLAPNPAEIVDHVETGVLAVDLKRIVKADHQSIVARRKLQYTGAVHISLAINKKGAVLGQPMLETIGLIDPENKGENQIEDNLHKEINGILEDMSWEELTDDHFVAEELRIGIRRFIFHVLGFKPKTTVHVLRV